jgi:hypothetical protein
VSERKPTAREAALSLLELLQERLDDRAITVGHGDDTLYVYEHKWGIASARVKEHMGFPVVSKYVGKVICGPAKR